MRYFLILGLVQVILSGSFAQKNPGTTLSGQVLDSNGDPVAYAYVKIDSLPVGALTDEEGKYLVESAPSGSFTVTVSFMGYKPRTKSIEIKAGASNILNFRLETEVYEMEAVTLTYKTEAQKLEESAQSVYVIETKEARVKTADMGEVLAGTRGVSVRRTGGLGSGTRFSLNGLTGDKVRFFLDGIPLEFTGYTFGIANVPVNTADRIEIYKGVVPIQFGADALGGAVNIVSPKMYPGVAGSVSYQMGSFGTHRMAFAGNYLDGNTGLFIGGGGFYDLARNNYKVDVEIPDGKGKLHEATVRRFHDSYRAGGLNVHFGVKNKRWADEFSVKGFYTSYTKDIQHNNLMTGIPYGDVVALRKSAGGNLIYRKDLGKVIILDVTAGYNHSEREFADTSHCAYDWYGECILVKNKPGEISSQEGASHQFTWDNSLYARGQVVWRAAPGHTFRFSTAPTYTRRTGDERFAGTFDPLTARGKLFTWVNGVEYELNALNDRLENMAFAKDYFQSIGSEEDIPGDLPATAERQVRYYGVGNSLRYQLSGRLGAKLSYEYATRLPRRDELFGDGQFTVNNLDLQPERSHNVNFLLTWKNKPEAKSGWELQANTFLRKVSNLILLIPSTDRTNVYQNVFQATSAGVEVSGNWTSPDNRIKVEGNSTYQDFYNSSKAGLFGNFYGDRIPNSPYFFANGSASYSFSSMIRKTDRITVFWGIRHVHGFYRSWESAGIKPFKLSIPDQQSHNAGITYRDVFGKRFVSSLTAEVQNLLNAKIYDFYGVQKPGRAFYIKFTQQF